MRVRERCWRQAVFFPKGPKYLYKVRGKHDKIIHRWYCEITKKKKWIIFLIILGNMGC